MNRFEWLASNSAPEGAPIRFVRGAFLYPEGGSLYIPSALLYSQWGERGSIHVVGEDLKPLPDRVELTYFSYLEDKLYRGSFALPHEEIARLFSEGFRSFRPDMEWETYRSIVAGAAPGGVVAIWVSGSERQVEVFFGRAEMVDLDWHATLGFPAHIDRREQVASTLAYAAGRSPRVSQMMDEIPFGLWETYRKPYRWRPAFEGIHWPERLRKIRFFNGERDYMMLPPEPPAEWVDRPLPNFYIFVDPQTRRSYNLTFDEQEIFSVFERLGGAGQPVELTFVRRPKEGGGATLHVFARGSEEEIELTKMKIEVYRAD
jgi:hypothetical protein